MPRSRHHLHRDHDHDDSDYESSRSRGIHIGRTTRSRPRAHHRSSSYDDRYMYRYGSRPRSSRPYRRDYDDEDSVYDSDDDDDDDDDYATSPPPPRRRHTRSEGGAHRRRRSRSRSRDHDHDHEIVRQKRDQAIKSALTAGAVEAFRQRNRSGDWMGEKGLRVATAAMSAAAIDTAVDRDPRRKGKRNVVGSTLGGLLVDKVAGRVLGGRR